MMNTSIFKPVKRWTGTRSGSLNSKSDHVSISYMKVLTPKQADYVYGQCKNEGIIGTEKMYKCDWNNKEKANSKLNPYGYAMLYDFDL